MVEWILVDNVQCRFQKFHWLNHCTCSSDLISKTNPPAHWINVLGVVRPWGYATQLLSIAQQLWRFTASYGLRLRLWSRLISSHWSAVHVYSIWWFLKMVYYYRWLITDALGVALWLEKPLYLDENLYCVIVDDHSRSAAAPVDHD